MIRTIALLGAIWSACSCASSKDAAPVQEPPRDPHAHSQAFEKTPMVREDEPRLRNVRRLTDGGENAEAYWNKEGTELIFQSTRDALECDQIFRMNADGSNVRQVSVPGGRTTCSYIQVDGSIIYASTHAHGKGCLWKPDFSQGYVWPLYPEMDIWAADADGSKPRLLFQSPGYDAEATICHQDGRIVFTSSKDGDLEIYTMDRDGKDVKRLTTTPGYDGGAFFSPDCSKIVWRAARPEGDDLLEYRSLLEKHMVRPTKLEIFAMNADGSNVVQVTKNGAANFGPYMHADNDHILFASNMDDPKGRNFDIYMIHIDGSGLERITRNPTFDGFPMWTHDGKTLVFASNRGNSRQGETNIFLADFNWGD